MLRPMTPVFAFDTIPFSRSLSSPVKNLPGVLLTISRLERLEQDSTVPISATPFPSPSETVSPASTSSESASKLTRDIPSEIQKLREEIKSLSSVAKRMEDLRWKKTSLESRRTKLQNHHAIPVHIQRQAQELMLMEQHLERRKHELTQPGPWRQDPGLLAQWEAEHEEWKRWTGHHARLKLASRAELPDREEWMRDREEWMRDREQWRQDMAIVQTDDLLLASLKLKLRTLEQEEAVLSSFDQLLKHISFAGSTDKTRRLGAVMKDALKRFNAICENGAARTWLREFMGQYYALCAFLVEHAEDLANANTQAEVTTLRKKLHLLTQNLRNDASVKAEGCRRLHETFMANGGGLSHLLGEADIEKGRLLFGNLTDGLKGMETSMCEQADFWVKTGKDIDNWSCVERISTLVSTSFPYPPLDSASYSPSTEDATAAPDLLGLVQNTQRVSTSYSDLCTSTVFPEGLQKLVTKPIMTRLDRTRVYITCVSDIATQQLQCPSRLVLLESLAQLTKLVRAVADLWGGLYRRMRFIGLFLKLFPRALRALPTTLDIHMQLSPSDRMKASMETASNKLHPYLIDSRAFLLAICGHFLSVADSWAHIEMSLESLPEDLVKEVIGEELQIFDV